MNIKFICTNIVQLLSELGSLHCITYSHTVRITVCTKVHSCLIRRKEEVAIEKYSSG